MQQVRRRTLRAARRVTSFGSPLGCEPLERRVLLDAVPVGVSPAAIEPSVTHYYRFETNNGAPPADGQQMGSARDSSGNGHDGIGVGTPQFGTTPFPNPVPQTGEANQFSLRNSFGDAVLVSGSATPVLAPTFTVEAFVRLNSVDPNTGDVKSILRVEDAGNQLFAFEFLNLRDGNGTNDLLVMPFSLHTYDLLPNVNYHVATSYDGATARLYVDGRLVDSIAYTGFTGSGSRAGLIGNSAELNAPFQGNIDELRITNGALSPSQFLRHAPVPPNGATFTPIGDLPGGTFNSAPAALSSDGTAVVGGSSTTVGGAFRWTADRGMEGIPPLAGGSANGAHGVSGNGAIVVGDSQSASGQQAFYWTGVGGTVGLGDLSGGAFLSDALGASGDGSVIVGYGTSAEGHQAFRWTFGGGMEGLGDLSGGTFDSEARATSADGRVVVGYGNDVTGRQAFRSTRQEGLVPLGRLPGDTSSEARAVSPNGSIVVGSSSNANGSRAFYWTAAAGMVPLAMPAGYVTAEARSVSADGSVIVGTMSRGAGSPREPFVWDAARGMRRLAEVLTGAGVDLTGWTLDDLDGVSADGKIVAGDALASDGHREGFVARLPDAPAVVGRYLFYNHSAFDGGDALPTPGDDVAIATDKVALLPGQSAAYRNVSNASAGINGVMIDVAGLGGTPTAADFYFRAGNDTNPAGWGLAPAPAVVSVRRGAGAGGSDRVELLWLDGSITNQWLQVTMRPTPNTGLASPDVFYFGSLVGDTGSSPMSVNAIDLGQVRARQLTTAGVTSAFDVNRDGRVNAIDLGLVRTNQLRNLQSAVAPAAITPLSIRRAVEEVLA